MNVVYLRKLIKEILDRKLNEEENGEVKRDSGRQGSKQVKTFLNSLAKSPLARSLKQIDTDAEKLEMLVKFAEIIDFPKDKLAKLNSQLRSK